MSRLLKRLASLLCRRGVHWPGKWKLEEAGFASGVLYRRRCRFCGVETHADFQRCGPIHGQ